MTTALTVFGICGQGRTPVFCYAFVRSVRGAGDYPPPTLPSGFAETRTRQTQLTGFEGVELIAWDSMCGVLQDEAILDAFAQARFTIPAECPIEPGRTLTGAVCEPSLLFEDGTWARVSGTGMLHLQALVPEGVLDAVATALGNAAGVGLAPEALSALIDTIGVQSGLRELFGDRRRFGTVDRFWRAEPEGAVIGPLLDVVPEKPDFRTKKPMRACHIRRHASVLDRAFTLHVRMQNFDEILRDCVLALPAGQEEIHVEASTHVSEIVLEAFNADGTIAQKSAVKWVQGFKFGIAALGRADLLPRIFSGAPDTPDLEKRARVSTVAFRGPALGSRSGAFDSLRQNDERIGAIVGPKRWSGECVWLNRGTDSQVGAIRWMKEKLEKPGVQNAYLVDPFLGSGALQRVIARQGNENINLTILVSPGRINPDAEVPDTEAIDDHLDKLAAAANAWSDRLCGNIVILHIKRGEMARQAFHDRYLCLMDQDGIPTVYLLSNSLSKAAGDWPFAISELNRVKSWHVYHYIQALLHGSDGARELESAEVWRSKQEAATLAGPQRSPKISDNTNLPAWAPWALTFLEKLRTSALCNSNNRAEMDAIVDSWIANWRSDADAAVLVQNIFQNISFRDHYVARVAMRFHTGDAQQRFVAEHLEANLLNGFVDALSKSDLTNSQTWQQVEGRDDLAAALARAICRHNAPTNFVRDRLNPVVHSLVHEIEFRRGPDDTGFNALQIATFLVSLTLEIAITSEAPLKFRQGMACDYLHWAGRIMRSEAAQTRLMAAKDSGDLWNDDIEFLVGQTRRAAVALGEPFKKAVERIMRDAHVPIEFKSRLKSA